MLHNGRYIDQIKIETVETTNTEVITQIENYYFNIDYFFRKREDEMEAAKTFDKEKTLTLILQRLEEMRHENEFNRKCIELLKAEELFNDFNLSNRFMDLIFDDSSSHLFEAMSNIAKESMMNVFRELAPRLKWNINSPSTNLMPYYCPIMFVYDLFSKMVETLFFDVNIEKAIQDNTIDNNYF